MGHLIRNPGVPFYTLQLGYLRMSLCRKWQQHIKKNFKRMSIVYHPDKGFSLDVLGQYGPQSRDEADRIVSFFQGSSSSVTYHQMLHIVWQICSDKLYRYIYHVPGWFPPVIWCDASFGFSSHVEKLSGILHTAPSTETASETADSAAGGGTSSEMTLGMKQT